MSRKMLFCLPNANLGGAESLFLHLLRVLREKGLDVNVFILVKHGDLLDEFSSFNLKTGFRYSILTKVFKIHLILGPFVLRNLVRKTDYTEIYTSVTNMNVIALITKLMTPLFPRLIIRETTLLEKFSFKFGFRIIYRFLYTNSDKIILQSSDMRTSFERVIGSRGNVQVISNPVKKQESISFMPDKEVIRIIMIGSLIEQKGYFELFRFLSTQSFETPILIDIYGNGKLQNVLQKMIDKISSSNLTITLKGIDKNIHKKFENYHFLLHWSNYEGYSNVIVEAISSGLPVLIRECKGGVNEQIIQGKNGIILYDTSNFLNEVVNVIKIRENGDVLPHNFMTTGEYLLQAYNITLEH